MKRLLAVSLGLCTLIAVPVSISAHNLGHIFLRDGRCLEIASAHEGPLIGVDTAYRLHTTSRRRRRGGLPRAESPC
jgi:hypothetical protein